MIEQARNEAQRILNTPANSSLLAKINALKSVECKASYGDVISANFSADFGFKEQIKSLAKDLMPWRKGPFRLGELLIDSEWQSFIKFNLLAPHLSLNGKTVADVGCNNGYYMYRMLNFSPARIVGFDPSVRTFMQFKFIEHFIKSGIKYEMLGVEHLPFYEYKFDTIFCLGVIYHRSDPVAMLKQLKSSLNSGGEAIIDTMFIDSDDEIALCPRGSYSKIANIYFIPSISALRGWCERAKFKEFEVLGISQTDHIEQRRTEWIMGQSLNDFLDPTNPNLTIEGYPAPKRVYVRVKI